MVGRALLLSLVVAVPTVAGAATHVGRIVAASGEVFVKRGEQPRAEVARGAYLEEGDVIETGANGSVRLLMSDKSVLALAANSGMAISAYAVNPKTKKRKASLTIMMGRLWAFVSHTDNPKASYEVRTQTAVAGVRGTELVFDVDASGNSALTVIEGAVWLVSEASEETIGGHESGSIAPQGTIALGSASEEAIAEIKETVRPEQTLEAKNVAERMKKTRRSAGSSDEDDSEQAEFRSGNALFEDVDPAQALGNGDGGGTGSDGEAAAFDTSFDSPGLIDFDPTTMARVRLSVEVRQ